MLKRCFVDVKLVDLMLGKIADAQLGGTGEFALGRFKFARQKLGKRGFSFAVATQKRNAVVLIDAQVQLFQDQRAAVADRSTVKVDDRGGPAPRAWGR